MAEKVSKEILKEGLDVSCIVFEYLMHNYIIRSPMHTFLLGV